MEFIFRGVVVVLTVEIHTIISVPYVAIDDKWLYHNEEDAPAAVGRNEDAYSRSLNRYVIPRDCMLCEGGNL